MLDVSLLTIVTVQQVKQAERDVMTTRKEKQVQTGPSPFAWSPKRISCDEASTFVASRFMGEGPRLSDKVSFHLCSDVEEMI